MGRKIQIIVAYDGTAFHGWQFQPGLRTVCGTLSEVIRRVVKHPLSVVGSGRTDAGVHAAGQVAHFETTATIPTANLRRAIGGRLPKDVAIVRARRVHPDFDARQSALSKCYRYRLYNAPGRPVGEFLDRYAYHFWVPLDVERIRAAAGYLVGEHDFSAMASKGRPRESYVRTVVGISVHRKFREVIIDVQGTGFLYNQVRNMVGTLLEVGRGHWEPDRVAWILQSLERKNAGPTAPAKGLSLQWVRYPPELLRPVADMETDRSLLPAMGPAT